MRAHQDSTQVDPLILVNAEGNGVESITMGTITFCNDIPFGNPHERLPRPQVMAPEHEDGSTVCERVHRDSPPTSTFHALLLKKDGVRGDPIELEDPINERLVLSAVGGNRVSVERAAFAKTK